MRRAHLFLLITFGLSSFAYSQERCAFNQVEEKLKENHPERSREKFENWLQQKIAQQKNTGSANRTKAGPYQIPVVVHVIHNNEPIGTGLNISDAQVLSQIKVLNNDYKRLNADAMNTPAMFQSVASSIDLQFVLAKQDADGLPTTGIVRVKGSKSGWTVDDDALIKAQSYWPAEKYLNLWVINLIDSYIGYAQFPSTTLPGTIPPYDRLTDGVVIDYRAFGSIDDGTFNLDSQYNKGRTATHEVGHFLGLLHTFEGGCVGQNDYVTDTPPLSESTDGCPTHPSTSCTVTTMFQNYMDYTNDVCMNLFTVGQISRMTTVIENSARRASLLTSPGLQDPVLLTLDLEARKVVAPEPATCGQAVIPKVEVRNRGNTTVSSVRASFSLNGSVVETKDFNVNLGSLATAILNFAPITLPEPSTNQISFSVVQVNSVTDGNATNNSISATTVVKTRVTPPLTEAFTTTPSAWTITNPDNGITWSNAVAPAAASTNRSMFIDFYNYEQESYKDFLSSPFINLTQSAMASLKFDVAYARFQGKSLDSLRVKIFADCQTEPATAVTIYNKAGASLATSNDVSSPFQPTGQNQWRSEVVSLDQFLGKNIQVVFEATNGYGNNLYLDNVQVMVGAANDVAVRQVTGPGPVLCEPNPRPHLIVQNLGSALVNELSVSTIVNGNLLSTQAFTNLNLPSGAEKEIVLNPIAMDDGSNAVQFSVANPAATDEVPDNNSIVHNWTIEGTRETIPLRQRFEAMEGWSVYSLGDAQKWEAANTNFGESLRYPAYTNTTKNQESWLVSPELDLSSTIEASMFFDVSYAKRAGATERLRIVATENCGLDYGILLYDQSGDFLSLQNSTNAWTPAAAGHWRNEYLNLNSLVGKEQVRLAFVVTNDNGNNLYLDNIEFFVDDDPSPPAIADAYAVYSSDTNPNHFKITFNLPEKEPTRVIVYSILGQVVIDDTKPETLNQTYTVNLEGQSTGIYVARVQIGEELRSFKLFVGR